MTIFEQIKEKITPSDLCEHLGIEVNRNFINCIIHEDNSPSMYVYHDNFFCCVCNNKLDIFDFLMKCNNIELEKAVNVLAELAGLKISKSNCREIQENKNDILKRKEFKEQLQLKFNDCYSQVCDRLVHLRRLKEIIRIQIHQEIDIDNAILFIADINFEEKCLHDLLDIIKIENTIDGLEKNISILKRGCMKLKKLRNILMSFDETLVNAYNCGFKIEFEEGYYWLINHKGKYRFEHVGQIRDFLTNLH